MCQLSYFEKKVGKFSDLFESGRHVNDDTHITSMKIVHLSRHALPLPPLSSYVQSSSTPLTLNVQFKRILSLALPLQIKTNQLKYNKIQGWLLYVIRSFLQVGLCFQYQRINLVWLSINFFPFSWSQPCPWSYFKKLKNPFSPSFYSEKMC